MSEETPAAPAQPNTEADIVRDLRLRSKAPRVTRLSRKVLIAAGAVASAAILGATIWALQASPRKGKADELYTTDHKAVADGLAGLPKDYAGAAGKGGAGSGAGIPQLGPPLPGDLGRPMLAGQATGGITASAAGGTPPATAADAAAQQQAQEVEGARLSKLFTGTTGHDQTARLPTLGDILAASTAAAGGEAARPSAHGLLDANGQDHKLGFVNATSDSPTVSTARLQPPASPYVVQAGAVIAGALVTGLRSDLPGQVVGQVTQDVYDSPTGRFLLIPQGAKLIGVYDAQVTFGQSRVLLVWTRLILPNGRSIVLQRQPGADAEGFSGLQDGVNDHWGQLLKGALLSTILSVGAEAGTSSSENNLAQALRAGASQSISQTGEQIVARDLNVQPTLTIRPGFPVRVIVDRDLVLEPYGK